MLPRRRAAVKRIGCESWFGKAAVSKYFMRFLNGPVISRANGPLRGAASAPGDKSISHRALIFGALASGTSKIAGLLESDDVLRTGAALRSLGAEIERDNPVWRVTGAPWHKPDQALYFGNSGTGARLMIGAVAGAGVGAEFHGDASLRSRPMGRVLEPLRMMGLEPFDRNGGLPVTVEKSEKLIAIDCKLASPSAQVKSAILLAALGANGVTRIHEPILCRDHTERMLGAFGVSLDFEDDGTGGRFITMAGGQSLVSSDVMVPGDPSSAAFLVAAASIVPDTDIVVNNVLINPLRIGFYETLAEMGANIRFENQRVQGGEPVADIHVRHAPLHGISVPGERAPSMIDEYPILSVVASFAQGETMMSGLDELRIKESDRIAAVEAGLSACGVDVKSGDDWLRVRGKGCATGGGRINTHHDHRIAMSFLVLGLASEKPVEIDDGSMIATSFPDFADVLQTFGANIAAA